MMQVQGGSERSVRSVRSVHVQSAAREVLASSLGALARDVTLGNEGEGKGEGKGEGEGEGEGERIGQDKGYSLRQYPW